MEWGNNPNQPQPIPQQSNSSEPASVATVSTQKEPICKLSGFEYFLKKTFSVYKNNFWTFLLLPAIPFAVSYFLSSPFLSGLESSHSPNSLVLVILIYLLSIIIFSWSSLSLLYAVKERENKISFGGALAKGWSNLGSYIWLSFLVAIIVAGGFILLIIPGIIFSVWFFLALYVLVDENKKGISALKRSKDLISGYVTAYWGRVLLFSLIFYIVPLLFSVIAKFSPVFGYISTIVNIVIAPLFVIFGFLVYENIKKIKEIGRTKSPREVKYTLLALLLFLVPLGIFASIFLVDISGSREIAKEAQIKAYMSQLRVEIEMYAGKTADYSYSGVSCSASSDLVSICNNIKETIGSEPVIRSSAQNYCLYVKLLKGGYYCLDNGYSYGDSYKTDVFPGNSGYCDGITFNCP